MSTKKTAILILILLISSLTIPTVIGASNTMPSDQQVYFYITKSKSSDLSSRIPATLDNLYKLIFTKSISKFKINGIGGPLSVFQLVKGYVRYSDGSNIPNGVAVTITDLDNGNLMTVQTQQASGGPGFYLVQVEDLNANNGDTIFVNVSYGGCQGNNSVIVNTSQGPSIYCNVTIYGNLPPNVPNTPSGPTSGHPGESYNYTTSTTDPDDDDVYYWFNWDDNSNSGWVGPYSSGETGTASHSWSSPGTYQVKAKAKDEHGAELGVCWSNLLNVTIGNQAPNTPSQPSGPTSGYHDVSYNYSTSTSDPKGDNISYGWDWDDGSPIEWSNWYNSGETCTMSHSWDDPGTYDVRVKAKDTWGNESGWSPVLTVVIENQAPDTPNKPSGPTILNIDESGTYSTSANDPDGDPVQYHFDWDANGSHDYSDWTDFVPSGTTASINHSWSNGGTYIVKAQARDEYNSTSEWSSGLSVFVNSPPNTPSNPDPYDGETDVDVDQDLSWTGGDPDPGDSVTYDVYFEANDPTPDVLVSNNQSGTTYDPGTMNGNTQYYWQIVAWDNHGAFTESPIWDFTTENSPPNTPSDPEPEDGATGVDVNADLSWSCSDPDGDPLTYDVYFEANDPTPDVLVSNNQSGTTYNPGTMEYNTHYYWEIVAWDNHGAFTEGPVWDFTTMSEPNDPPYEPSDPDPEDGATDVDVNVDLSWNCSDPDPGDTLVYDVYLEANDPTPDTKVANDISENTFDPGTLEYETTYYWRIIAKDNHGAVTEGPIWHFTTEQAPVPDLDCSGGLSWSNVEPGSTVTGSFTVKNIGEPESELDWEIIEWPDWGTWNFDPEEGEDLTPEDGEVTVNVTVIAPDDPNTEFTGNVKVINSDDPSDYCIIPVYLKTPVNQQSSIVLSALSTNLMTSSLLSRMISIKMLFLQRFSRTTPSNSATPSSTSATEDIEDSTSSSSSNSDETQQSDNQYSEANEQISQNIIDSTPSSSSSGNSEESSTSSTISEDDGSSEFSSSSSSIEISNK